MPDTAQPRCPSALRLHGPMFVDGCRLDAMVMGPDGNMTRPYLAVIITPAMLDMPHFSYRLPASVDENFRELADTMRDVLGGGQ